MSSNYSYKITPLAKQDIDEALSYITEKLCNQKAANDLFTDLINAIEKACFFPRMNETCEMYLIDDEKIRRVIVDNFILVYEIKDELKQINILRFRYAKMDFTKMKI